MKYNLQSLQNIDINYLSELYFFAYGFLLFYFAIIHKKAFFVCLYDLISNFLMSLFMVSILSKVLIFFLPGFS